MDKLIEVSNRLASMAADYDSRNKSAKDQIRSLNDELQHELQALKAATTASDAAAYAEHDSRVKFLSACIEAAQSEQVEPMFHSSEQVESLRNEHSAAVKEAVKPLYDRFMNTMDEQKALLKEMEKVSAVSRAGVSKVYAHAMSVGCVISPWRPDPTIKQYVEQDSYYVRQFIKRMLNK